MDSPQNTGSLQEPDARRLCRARCTIAGSGGTGEVEDKSFSAFQAGSAHRGEMALARVGSLLYFWEMRAGFMLTSHLSLVTRAKPQMKYPICGRFRQHECSRLSVA